MHHFHSITSIILLFTNHALKKGTITPTCHSLAGLFIHYLDKYGLSGFQYDFNTSYSTTDLLTVEDEIIVSALNMSVVSRMSNLISQKLFTEFFYWYFFSNLTSVEYFARFSDLFLVSSGRLLCVVLDGTSLQEYNTNVRIPESSSLCLISFLVYSIYLTDDVICNISCYAHDIIHYSNLITFLICGSIFK